MLNKKACLEALTPHWHSNFFQISLIGYDCKYLVNPFKHVHTKGCGSPMNGPANTWNQAQWHVVAITSQKWA